MTWTAGLMCAAMIALASSGCRKEGAVPSRAADDSAPVEPLKPLAPEELPSWYQSCSGNANRWNWVEYKKCFAADVVSYNYDMAGPPTTSANELFAALETLPNTFSELVTEEQLILVNGRTIVVVLLMKGTMLPPGSRKFGFLMANVVELNEANVIAREWTFGDENTAKTQLGVGDRPARAVIEKGVARPTVSVAKGDDAERNAVAVAKTRVDAWNQHDAKALEASLAADIVWREAAATSDQDKISFLGDQKAMWSNVPDVTIKPQTIWAAGDYVVTIGDLKGSKGGKAISVPLLEVVRFEDGKVKEGWRWYNGAAMARQLGAE